jgi:thioredoxin reductase (NADPH)
LLERIKYSSISLYRQCSHEKPEDDSNFWIRVAFHGGFYPAHKKIMCGIKNTFDKVPFLLVRFLWASKENEQQYFKQRVYNLMFRALLIFHIPFILLSYYFYNKLFKKLSLFMVIIVGAGPIGLATAIELKRRNIPSKIIDQGGIVNSIFNYPKDMTFFSTSERLEIGDVPFISHGPKPTRREALEYYRRAAESYSLDINLYEKVEAIKGKDGAFTVQTDKSEYESNKVVVATGFYDVPRMMNIPGENLPKVKHYYDEAHAYAWQNVLVIGGGNSAVDAALETFRAHANITMSVRKPELKESVKYWVKPDIENRLKNGEITGYFNTSVKEIKPKEVILETPEGTKAIANDFVLAMTGYQPNFELMKKFGIDLSNDGTKMPIYDEKSLETNRKGVYVAGVVCGGRDTSSLFIENTRVHAEHIAEHIIAD